MAVSLEERAGAWRFRWMPGMRTVDALVVSVDDCGMPVEVVFDGTLCVVGDEYDMHGARPDLDDPATLGCIEHELLPEAWGCDEWRRLTVEPAGKGWCLVLRNGRHRPPSRAQPGWDLDPVAHPRYRNVSGPFGTNEFTSKADALVAALEAAPGEPGEGA